MVSTSLGVAIRSLQKSPFFFGKHSPFFSVLHNLSTRHVAVPQKLKGFRWFCLFLENVHSPHRCCSFSPWTPLPCFSPPLVSSTDYHTAFGFSCLGALTHPRFPPLYFPRGVTFPKSSGPKFPAVFSKRGSLIPPPQFLARETFV